MTLISVFNQYIYVVVLTYQYKQRLCIVLGLVCMSHLEHISGLGPMSSIHSTPGFVAWMGQVRHAGGGGMGPLEVGWAPFKQHPIR